jgi:RNA polymerase sigma factor for flagellar operon FliA
MVTIASTPPPSRLSTEGERLVHDHLGVVEAMVVQVGRRLPLHVDRDDLYGAGAVALVDAGRTFDPGRGVEFPAFAAKRVRGAMLDELRRWDWVTRSVRTRHRRRTCAVEALEAELGRTPRAAEVATELGITLDQLRRGESETASGTVASLLDLERTRVPELCAAATTPADVLVEREVLGYVRDAVEALPERERRALGGYYLQERPMREIAAELGVTESRVSQLCGRALVLLRESLMPYLQGHGTWTPTQECGGSRSSAFPRPRGCGPRPRRSTRGAPASARAGSAGPPPAERTRPPRDRG